MLLIGRGNPLVLLTRVGKAHDHVGEAQNDHPQHEINANIDQSAHATSEPSPLHSSPIKTRPAELILDDQRDALGQRLNEQVKPKAAYQDAEPVSMVHLICSAMRDES